MKKISRNITILASALFCLSVSGTILAANALSSGMYFEGDVGYGTVNSELENYSTDKNGTMWNATVGYKFNKNLALEVGYAKLADTSTDFGDYNTDNYYVDAAVKGILPFADGWELFGKAGIADAHTQWPDYVYDQDGEASSKVVGYFAGGINYYFTPNFAIDLQTSTTTKSGDEVPAMYGTTLGLTYLFGGQE